MGKKVFHVLFIRFLGRFQYTTDKWGEEMRKQAETLGTGWWQQIVLLKQKYNIDKNEGTTLCYGDWKNLIKHKIRCYEEQAWRTAVTKQSSLKYLSNKPEPKYEKYMDGSKKAIALFKLRTGDWGGWDRRKHWEVEGTPECRLCGKGEENLSHLIQNCKETRDIFGSSLEQNNSQDIELVLGLGEWAGQSYMDWTTAKIRAAALMKKIQEKK